MKDLAGALELLGTQLTIPMVLILEIAEEFRGEMIAGLAGRQSSLKMLPSYLAKPTGGEKGSFLAVDFGGTNVRVILVALQGSGKFAVTASRSFPLKNPAKGYDYTAASTSATQLFDFLAENIAGMITPDGTYSLGHTFSFPCRQTGLNQATLIIWTKEIKTQGVEGQDVGELLQAALDRRQLQQVTSKAIINDTVGTLMAAGYGDPYADIAAICGTGHNTCYLEQHSPLTGKPMVMNMESGNFDKLARIATVYDDELDLASEKPGEQRLEKMVSGRYVGELVSIIAGAFIEENLLFQNNKPALSHLPALRGEDVAACLADETAVLSVIGSILEKQWGIAVATAAERGALKTIATLVAARSARLVAATFLGVIQHIDSALTRRHTIAIDGSLYEKMPLYAEVLQGTLDKALGNKAEYVTACLTKDGSGIGAAIAAAIGETIK